MRLPWDIDLTCDMFKPIAIQYSSQVINSWKCCPSGCISPTPINIFFLILYRCIYYNPLKKPVKFRQDKIQNSRLIAIFVGRNWQNISKFCPSGWISPTQMNICFRYFTHAFTTIILWILIANNRLFYPVGDTIALAYTFKKYSDVSLIVKSYTI